MKNLITRFGVSLLAAIALSLNLAGPALAMNSSQVIEAADSSIAAAQLTVDVESGSGPPEIQCAVCVALGAAVIASGPSAFLILIGISAPASGVIVACLEACKGTFLSEA